MFFIQSFPMFTRIKLSAMPWWHCTALLLIFLSYFVVTVKHLQSKYFWRKLLFLVFCILSSFIFAHVLAIADEVLISV